MVCAAMLRPGKHQYIVKSKANDFKSEAQTVVSQARTEPPLPNLSERYIQSKLRDFTHDKSIFSEFKEDDVQLLKLMYDHDMRKWRISRVVQVDFDYKSIKGII